MKRDSSFVDDDDDDAGKIRRKLIKCDCQLSKSPLLFCFLFILNLKRQKTKMRREIHKCGGSSERMFNIFKINISRIKDFGAARNERRKEEPARKRNLKKRKRESQKRNAQTIFIYFFIFFK
jgi:hypothetical protein